MAWTDDDETVFPTRHGGIVGRGLENRMIDNLGGPDGIRQKIINLPDGSTVRLRTRAGMPEFIVEKPKGSTLFYSHNIAYVTAGARLLSPTPSINLTGKAISFDRLMDTFRCDGTVATLSPTVSVNMDGSARLALTCKMFETDYYPVGAALGTDAEGATVIYTGNVYHGELTFEPTTFLPLIDGESPPENSYRAVGAFTDYGSYEVSPLLNRVDTDARVYWLYQKLGTAYGQDFMYYPTTFYWNLTGDEDNEVTCAGGREARNYALVVGGYTGILTDPSDISHTYRYDWVNGLRTYPTYICDDDSTRYIMVAYLSTTTTKVFVTLHMARTPDRDVGVEWQKVLDGYSLPLDLSNYATATKVRIKAALQFSPSNKRILIEVKRSIYDAIHAFEIVLSGGDDSTLPEANIVLHKLIGVTQNDVVASRYANTAFTTYTFIDVPDELLVWPEVDITTTNTTEASSGDVVTYENPDATSGQIAKSGYLEVKFTAKRYDATASMRPMVSTEAPYGSIIYMNRRVWVSSVETNYIGMAYSKDNVPTIVTREIFKTTIVKTLPSVEIMTPTVEIGGGGCTAPWNIYSGGAKVYGTIEGLSTGIMSVPKGVYGVARQASVSVFTNMKIIRNDLTMFETQSELPMMCKVWTHRYEGVSATIDATIDGGVLSAPKITFTETKTNFYGVVSTGTYTKGLTATFGLVPSSLRETVIDYGGGHRVYRRLTASRAVYNFGLVGEVVEEWDDEPSGFDDLVATNKVYGETGWWLPFDEDMAPVLRDTVDQVYMTHFNPKTGEFSTDGKWWC